MARRQAIIGLSDERRGFLPAAHQRFRRRRRRHPRGSARQYALAYESSSTRGWSIGAELRRASLARSRGATRQPTSRRRATNGPREVQATGQNVTAQTVSGVPFVVVAGSSSPGPACGGHDAAATERQRGSRKVGMARPAGLVHAPDERGEFGRELGTAGSSHLAKRRWRALQDSNLRPPGS